MNFLTQSAEASNWRKELDIYYNLPSLSNPTLEVVQKRPRMLIRISLFKIQLERRLNLHPFLSTYHKVFTHNTASLTLKYQNQALISFVFNSSFLTV